MRRIEVSVEVDAPARECFDFVADPANVTRYMSGITEYTPITERWDEVGSRFHARAEIAGRAFPTVMEITEWRDGARIVATSVEGVKLRGSWTVEAMDEETTEVTLLQEYELPGVFRLLPSGPIEAGIRRELERSLSRLKRLVES